MPKHHMKSWWCRASYILPKKSRLQRRTTLDIETPCEDWYLNPPNISSECFLGVFFRAFLLKKHLQTPGMEDLDGWNLQCKIQTSPALNEPFVMLCKLSGAARYLGARVVPGTPSRNMAMMWLKYKQGLCTNH